MKILFRDVRADKRKAALLDLDSIVREEIEKVLDKEVKPALVGAHEAVVANWKNKPGFAARKFLTADDITINVFPTGEHKMIWIYVDQGTKPHTIPERTPKKAPVLAFMASGTYVPKTRPTAKIVSGGGVVVGGEQVFATRAKAFTHPGSKARNFTVTIAEDAKPDFKRLIENAFRRAARRVQE